MNIRHSKSFNVNIIHLYYQFDRLSAELLKSKWTQRNRFEWNQNKHNVKRTVTKRAVVVSCQWFAYFWHMHCTIYIDCERATVFPWNQWIEVEVQLNAVREKFAMQSMQKIRLPFVLIKVKCWRKRFRETRVLCDVWNSLSLHVLWARLSNIG